MHSHDDREMTEEDLIVELRDTAFGRVIYSPSIPRYTIVGALIGALLCGAAAWLIASGLWEIGYVGQFSASGEGWATFTGAGAGAPLGGLIGSTLAYRRIKNAELRMQK